MKLCTVTSPLILPGTGMALRIFSSGGVWANLTVIRVPPLKSIPYLSPPFMTILPKPGHRQHQRGDDEGPLLAQKIEIRVLE